MIRQLFDLLFRHARLFHQVIQGTFFTQTGGDRHVRFLIRQDGGQCVILRRVLVDLIDHAGQTADYLT